jgi:Amt family ammonium transporter
MGVVFYAIKRTVGLRVSKAEELRGLDIGEHGLEAYSGFQIFTTQ